MAAKRGFRMDACTPKRRHIENIPKASDVKENDPSFVDAPESMVSQIGNPKLAIGVDIESHGWPHQSSKKGHVGQFGFYTMKDDATLKFARIVQIGWVIGQCRDD